MKQINQKNAPLKARQMCGKYRVKALLANGGFAKVYSAFDTIEGVWVALKIPHEHFVSEEMMELFRQEVRIVASLDHPNILPLKDASIIDGRFVVTTRLGKETFDQRISRRMSVTTAFDFAEQMISAVAFAHQSGIIHCDIKPENFIMFDDNRIRLADFGIAKVSHVTVASSGTGTVGHMAPEQAMGRPSRRSDVFSLGLILYRMLSGHWPEYPFEWPPVGAVKLRRKRVHPEFIRFIQKAIAFNPKDRFVDASSMYKSFNPLSQKALRHLKRSS